MAHLGPLRFQPVFRDYVWGGRRLETRLAKPIPAGDHWAESWEIVDHGADQSVVASGPLAGTTLRDLCQQHPTELFGTRAPPDRFPLLFKFLDAQRALSVQVHPNDTQAAQLAAPDLGKTEAWVVLDAEPGSLIYAGLKRGFDRAALEREVHRGTTELCLHRFEPRPGDCIFIPAGTVHALGAGLLIAEIQQSSDTTFRLFDWNRVGTDGEPRPLHIEQALQVIDQTRGPVEPQTPARTQHPQCERLVGCDKFVLDRWTTDRPITLGGDQRFHIVAVLEGEAQLEGLDGTVRRGETLLLPAALGALNVAPQSPVTLLDIYEPTTTDAT